MRSLPLLLCAFLLLPALPLIGSGHAQAGDEYTTREVDSFETVVNETSEYGTWSSFQGALGAGASSYVQRSTSYMTHGFSSVRCNVSGTVPLGWAEAGMNFTSNSNRTLFEYDRLTLDFRLSRSDWIAYLNLYQYNGSVEVDRVSAQLSGTTWQTLTLDIDWLGNATHFRLVVFLWHVFSYSEVPSWCDLYLDNFRVYSGEVDVRVRYWNLYTGLGYYTEKLLARYYTLEDGWVDIWQGEFQAYKGDEVLLAVTDVFGRNVWTGLVPIDSDPVYVDIMVPIVTVHIVEPDWYNDSVPMEWRITCLPWGADGPAGMTLPAIGFEFEVLAGWYNIAWLANGVVEAGNQTLLVEGDATIAKSFMLTDLSIPIDPDYEVQIKGDDGTIYDIRDFDDLVNFLAALYEDNRVKAALILSSLTSLAVAFWSLKKRKERQSAMNRGG